MIPSNLNRCRFEILENNKQTRESTGVGTPVSVVLGTAGKALFALRHLLGPAVTPTKGVRRPLEHFRALPAHGPRNAVTLMMMKDHHQGDIR
jgi:hypothetical protein